MSWPDFAKSYDVVAADYAAAFADELDRKPFDRELLDRFAAGVAGRGPVWEVGCGPAAQVARYLADRGVEMVGTDISPGGIAYAAKAQPDLEFRVADLRDLPAADGSLRGIVAFYSLIHLPRAELAAAFRELRRVLVPGGEVLVGMHGGEGEIGASEFLGHTVEFRATLVGLDELAGWAESAGFEIVERHARPPYDDEHPTERLYLWARA
jgi:SAM-dependent methyltransferase